MKHSSLDWCAYLAWAMAVVLSATSGYGADSSSSKNDDLARRAEYVQKALQGEGSPMPGKRRIGSGTGFYVAPLKVLTNRHVVDDCTGVTLHGSDGQTVIAVTTTTDKSYDLALVTVESAPPSLQITPFHAKPEYTNGNLIGTVGYPDHGFQRIQPFHTMGQILGPDRKDDRISRFAIRADIRAGNSGGPVFDSQGAIIGIITARIDTVTVFKKTGRSLDDIGYAIANRPIIEFLTRQGVKPALDDRHDRPLDQDLASTITPIVTRVTCWR